MFDVLAGSYAPAAAAGIRRFRFDPDLRVFHPVAGRSGVPFPAYLIRSSVHGFYYAVSETTACADAGPGTTAAQTGQPGTIWALGPDPTAPDPAAPGQAAPEQPAPGSPTPACALATGGDLPTHIAVHPSGCWLAVSNYGSHPSPGSISIVRLHPGGSLAGIAGRREHAGRGPVAARQDSPHVHSTAFTAAGDRLIAADLGADTLVVYDFDATDARLSVVSVTPSPPGWGPRYMQFSPDERTLLVVGELSCELGAFTFDGDTLELVARVPTLEQPRAGVLPADIHFAPGGRRAYVSNRGAVNSIATFDTTRPQRPELIGETASGGTWPRHFAVAPDGRFLVVANEHSGQLTALAVDSGGVAASPLAVTEMPAVSYVDVSSA